MYNWEWTQGNNGFPDIWQMPPGVINLHLTGGL